MTFSIGTVLTKHSRTKPMLVKCCPALFDVGLAFTRRSAPLRSRRLTCLLDILSIVAGFMLHQCTTGDTVYSPHQGRIQTKTNGGLQVDHPVIGGSRKFEKMRHFRDIQGGGGLQTPKKPGYGPAHINMIKPSFDRSVLFARSTVTLLRYINVTSTSTSLRRRPNVGQRYQ